MIDIPSYAIGVLTGATAILVFVFAVGAVQFTISWSRDEGFKARREKL